MKKCKVGILMLILVVSVGSLAASGGEEVQGNEKMQISWIGHPHVLKEMPPENGNITQKMLEEKFPEVKAEIEVRDPEMLCPACGYRTNEMIDTCPDCETKMNLETNSGVRIES